MTPHFEEFDLMRRSASETDRTAAWICRPLRALRCLESEPVAYGRIPVLQMRKRLFFMG